MTMADTGSEDATPLLIRRAGEMLAGQLGRPLEAGLHLVSTPIGNLADVTLRGLAVLARADFVYAEDTRHSRRLLDRYGIDRTLSSYHDHNAERERPHILGLLAAGRSVALISDAGTPLVSDPGYKLVRDVLDAGHRVTSLPGPSAVLAALTCAGLPTDCFVFAGFLPAKQSARRERITAIAGLPGTIVLFEAPGRVAETFAELAGMLGNRRAALARELTKLHEELRHGSLAELAASAIADPPRGECVLLIGPPAAPALIDDAAIRTALRLALQGSSLRDAARDVAERLGVPKKRAYDLAVAIKSEGGSAS